MSAYEEINCDTTSTCNVTVSPCFDFRPQVLCLCCSSSQAKTTRSDWRVMLTCGARGGESDDDWLKLGLWLNSQGLPVFASVVATAKLWYPEGTDNDDAFLTDWCGTLECVIITQPGQLYCWALTTLCEHGEKCCTSGMHAMLIASVLYLHTSCRAGVGNSDYRQGLKATLFHIVGLSQSGKFVKTNKK